jgi:hypothetical protein
MTGGDRCEVVPHHLAGGGSRTSAAAIADQEIEPPVAVVVGKVARCRSPPAHAGARGHVGEAPPPGFCQVFAAAHLST